MIKFPSLEGYKNPVSEKFCVEDLRNQNKRSVFFTKSKEPKPAQGHYSTDLLIVKKECSCTGHK